MIYLGYRTPSVADLTLKEKIALAVELEMYSVELGPSDVKTMENVMELKDLSAESGIIIKALAAGAVPVCNPDLKNEGEALVKGLVEKAKILGVDSFLARTMNPEPDAKQADTWKHCSDFMRFICEVCQDNGIKFAFEADRGNFVNSLERTERLMELVNHKNFYINYDPANFYMSGSDPLKVIDRLKDYIISGHIKDGVYRTDKKSETKIGEGEVDYAAIFKKLNDENITVAMHLEHCKSAQVVIDGAKYIKKVLASLEGQ